MLLLTKLSDVFEELENCNSIFVSDLKILEAVSQLKKSKDIEIILSLELGDLRDGINPDNLNNFMKNALKIDNINIRGIGTNLGCLAGKLPDEKTFNILTDCYYNIKTKLGFEFKKISIGGTVFYDFIEQQKIPKEINQIRIGEAIYFGYNMSYKKNIESLRQDTFVFSSEIIEIYDKRVDNSERGFNAFGEKSNIKKSGIRKRAVLDFGKLIAEKCSIFPIDNNIFIDGQTHNHTVIDISDSNKKYNVGDNIDFTINYNSAATIFLSDVVKTV
ncbi:MAG TPA: alanine racemase [Spirochaetota bacterium]|nr:alanine racemase [Spirochaetota bacterium]